MENTREYHGVRIVSQTSEKQISVLIPGLPNEYSLVFCHPLKPPSDCINIKWEQKLGCKDVNENGYIEPSKETCPNVQNGHNTATTTEATARLAGAR